MNNLESAYDGQQALDLMRDRDYNFDLIFTDYQMPVMNGAVFAAKVRELQMAGFVSPDVIIVLASGVDVGDQQDEYLIGGRVRPTFD